MRKTILAAAIGLAALLTIPTNPASAWPDRPVRIIVGFTPGGSSDLIARMLAPEISARIGGTVLVENKPGAASTTATDYVAKQPADGHTLILTTVSSAGMAPSIYKELGYDPVKDFAHIAMVAYVGAVLLVDSKLPAKNFAEFLTYVKSRSGQINFGTGGHGTMNHVTGVMLGNSAGIDVTHVPYKGSAEATNDLLAGAVTFQIDALNQNIGRIEAGTVRALAITEPQRSKAAPDVPTFKELGYPDIVALNWNGLAVPAKTPPDVVAKLSKAVQDSMALPEVQAKLLAWGMTPASYNPEQTTQFVKDEVAMWRSVVSRAPGF